MFFLAGAARFLGVGVAVASPSLEAALALESSAARARSLAMRWVTALGVQSVEGVG